MKRKLRFLFFIILILIAVFFVYPFTMDIVDKPMSDITKTVTVTVNEGTSTLGIGKILKEDGLIRNRYAFLIKVKTSRFNGKLGSGSFELSPTMKMTEIISKLCEPKPILQTVTVTFPEGYSIEQMAEELEKNSVVSKKDFLEAVGEEYDFPFIKNIPNGNYKYRLQGFLFPSTYEFYKNSRPREVIEKMLTAFNEVYSSIGGDFVNIFEKIIIASLIEKEAKLESERPIVSGVIANRTKKGMAYQIDASVLYAATDGLFNNDESVFIAHNIKNLDSPYNTYMYSGLPVGPICNPGITSIKAALSPMEHNYLYYHTDTKKNDGSHIFTETFSQHINTMK